MSYNLYHVYVSYCITIRQKAEYTLVSKMLTSSVQDTRIRNSTFQRDKSCSFMLSSVLLITKL